MLKENMKKYLLGKHHVVLILILLEHAQRAFMILLAFALGLGLNPYFIGTCSKRTVWRVGIQGGSLNPYFIGTCSKRYIIVC